MAGRLIDEPRLKSLIDSIGQIVKDNGVDQKFILPSENSDTVIQDVTEEIASNIAEFDNWFFEKTLDERKDRLAITDQGALSSNDDLASKVREVVMYNLEGMREVGELDVEPELESIVNRLVNYIVHWQDWYYDYKALQHNLDWVDHGEIDNDIYIGSNYGDEDNTNNIYNEDPPFLGKPSGPYISYPSG